MKMEISVIVAWLVLILGWIVPAFIKDTLNKRFIGIVLSSFATGMFIGILLTIIF